MFKLHPARSRALTTSGWPWRTARCAGVERRQSCTSTLTPAFRSTLTTSRCPCTNRQSISASGRHACAHATVQETMGNKDRLLYVVITSCAAKCKGVRSLLLLLLALACLSNIFLTAGRLPTIAAPAPPSTPIARVIVFRDEQCACTSTSSRLTVHRRVATSTPRVRRRFQVEQGVER